MSEFNSIDDFLGHSGGGGSGRRYLKNWKKDGSIRIWLSMLRKPAVRWAHNIPQVNIFEDRDTRDSKKTFWSRDHVCWEDETFLLNQYKRDENGRLTDCHPPKKCALDRLVDVIAQGIATGQLDWLDEVFRFEGATDPKDDVVIHAGGLTNLFSKKNMPESQKRQLKAAKIYQTESFKENFHAKCQYVLSCVDQDDVGSGLQIATQVQAVGNAIKAVIRDSRASLGEEDGNPLVTPYCIELTYDDSKTMDKKYHARRMERYKLTPEIERVIRKEEPDLTRILRPHNQAIVRGFLEKYAVVDLPWDRIFDVPDLGDKSDEDEEDTDFPPKDEVREEPKRQERKSVGGAPPREERAPQVGSRREQERQSSSRDVAMIPCDKCKAPMREDETECRKCGAKYELDDEEPAPPPKQVAKGTAKGDRLPFSKF